MPTIQVPPASVRPEASEPGVILSPKLTISRSVENPARISLRGTTHTSTRRSSHRRWISDPSQEPRKASNSPQTVGVTRLRATTSSAYSSAWWSRTENSSRPARNAPNTLSMFQQVLMITRYPQSVNAAGLNSSG